MIRYSALLIIMVLVTISAFGVYIGMNHDEGTMAGNCPLMGGFSAICPMNLMSHINIWQNIFIALVLILFVFVALLALANRNLFYKESSGLKKILKKETSFLSFSNYLKLILSQGILHPRLNA